MCITRKKLADAQSIRAVARTQKDDVTLSLTNKRQPPQDERPHENLAQLLVFSDNRPQLLRANLEKLARLRNPPEHQTALAGNHRDLASKFARTMCRYSPLTRQIRLYDFHPARQHNEKWNLGVVGSKQDFPRLNFAHFAEWTKSINLRLS